MFLLLLMGLGAVGVKAQVRIGGDTIPNAAAVLDLNVDDTATGTKGLALPRVNLNSNTTILTGATANISGMMVYNTGGSLNAGVYFWNGSNWIMGLTDTIPGGGLEKTSDGKIGIKKGGVTADMLASDVTALGSIYRTSVVVNMNSNTAGASGSAPLPAGCTPGYSWAMMTGGNFVVQLAGTTAACYRLYTNSSNTQCTVWLFCLK